MHRLLQRPRVAHARTIHDGGETHFSFPTGLFVFGNLLMVSLIIVGLWDKGEGLSFSVFSLIVYNAIALAIWRLYSLHRQPETTNHGIFNDHFIRTIKLLESKKFPVRLGGILTLWHLNEVASVREQILLCNILSACARTSHELTLADDETTVPISPDAQAILELFGTEAAAHQRVQQKYILNLAGSQLCHANLSHADLRGLDLSHADLSGADLSGANLMGTNLLMAELRGANLSGADLSGARLDGANLSFSEMRDANLSGAHLFEATLRGADMIGANLNAAHLDGADLFDANLRETTLNGTHLSHANLDHAHNLTPEQLDGALTDASPELPPK